MKNWFTSKIKFLFYSMFCSIIFVVDMEALEIGDVAPDIFLPSLLDKGTDYSLEDKLGQVVYIDFWASWCAPCKLSLPTLEHFFSEYSDSGFSVFAVNVDEVEEAALDFLEEIPVSYPVLSDASGKISQLYQVMGMPSGYLVSREGIVAYSHIGFRAGDEKLLRSAILTELAK